MFALIRYYYKCYLKSYKFILPIILFASYMAFAYSSFPIDIQSNTILSAGIVYFLMAWVGFSFVEIQQPVLEYIIQLKTSHLKICLSKILLLLMITVGFSVICTVYPTIFLPLTSPSSLTRACSVNDVLLSLIVHIVFGFLGGMLGLMFHHLNYDDKKVALVFIPFFLILGIITPAINTDYPVTEWVTWIFPPIHRVITALRNYKYVHWNVLVLPIFSCILYSTVICTIYLKYKAKN